MWAWTLLTVTLMTMSALAGLTFGRRLGRGAAPPIQTPRATPPEDGELEHLRRDHEHMREMVGELLDRQRALRQQLHAAQTTPPERAPTSHDKGAAFEQMVVLAVDWQDLTLEEWRSDKEVAGISPMTSRYPDLVLTWRGPRGEQERLAIECKWRAQVSARGEVTWCNARQLQTYQRYSREHEQPVFIALGVGGAPGQPHALYLVPLDALPEPTASTRQLAPYLHPLDAPIVYHAAMRRLGAP